MATKKKDAEDQDERPRDADRLEGVAHPRETEDLIGQAAALEAFDAARASGRMHHAWLLTGPRGVGKATTAYAIARRILSGGSPEDDARNAAQIRAGAHPRLLEIRRSWNAKTNKFRSDILVDDVRRLTRFFGLSAADGGWRVALVDPADDLNIQAANALLKALEEPPALALFLVTSHAPGRLPATIRSRCRRLTFEPLTETDAVAAIQRAAPDAGADDAAALAQLSGGAPGEALRLRAIGGLESWRALETLHQGLPRFDRAELDKLMSSCAGRAGADRFETLGRLWPMFIERLAVAAVRRLDGAGPGAAEIAALAEKLAPTLAAARRWAEAVSETRARLERAQALNLDPERAILDTALMLEETASAALSA